MYTDEMIKFIQEYRKREYSWEEIAELFEEEFGVKKSAHALTQKYLKLVESQTDLVSDDTLVKNLKGIHSARKTASKVRKENKVLVEHQLTLDEFLEKLKEVEAEYPVKLHKKVKLLKKRKTKRTVVAHMADNHIGAVIKKETMDGINEFNPEIAARRIAYYVKQVVQYKPHHREDSELVLVFNGDMLHGVIHGTDTANVLPASTQHVIALRIYSQAISFLAQNFAKIRVVGETGNHSRFTHKLNKGRQTEEKWDSFETIMYTSLQEKFRDNKNIEFVITKSPYTIIDIQGHKALITHGDTVLNVGQPGNSINVKSITTQINSIASSLGYRIDMVLVGHVHKATYIILDNGTHLIIDGPLSGNDEYVQSLGILCSNPVQQIFEVTPDMVVGDMRFVKVDQGDNDESLDKIIEIDKELL
jgi:UDP-2,3-diacylglucosamine pyrophosphatase LpxH